MWADGLAMFYKKDKFTLMSSKRIDLNECFDHFNVSMEMYPDEDRKKDKLGMIAHF